MTFLAPAFLAGLLAIGLPLWLHRLSSTNPNRQAFSSLMFLEAGEPRRVLAKKLQYLLLLALRIALLVLLALAFAQPAWFTTPSAAAGEDAELHLVVVDASASMSHGERWQRARQAAEDALAEMSGDDRGQIVAAARTAELVTDATADGAVLRQGLDTIEPTAFRVDYGRLSRALEGILRDAELPVVLHFVTDAQQTAMPTRFAELAPRMPATLRIHDVAGEDDANWAVESFGGSPLSGELQATVRSFADAEADKTLRLELNGTVAEERSVTLAPGGRRDVEFDALELRPGPNRVTVTLEPGDALEVDDRRYLAMKRPEPRSVLIVSGGGARSGDDVFVGAALETLGALALDTTSIAVSALSGETLADYSFVVVTDAGTLGEGEAARLGEYVESGGGLLLALGPRSSGLAAVPVTGQSVQTGAGMSMRGGEFEAVGEVDASHPALRGIDELRSGKFFRYVRLEPGPEDDVLAALDGGAPLLVERRVGAGRTLVYASTLDRQWNDLPVQPVFVPFIAGLANHLLGGAGFSAEAELGSTLAIRAMGMEGGQIFDPEGEPALGLGGGTGDVVLEQVGFYEVVGGGRSEIVAVNPDPRESDLAAVDAATIERWQGLGFTDETATGAAAGAETAEIPVSLGPWLLFLLVAAVLMESLVGNWHLRVRRGIAT
ncbi:MAG: BatA and WFA domain-containing protein [Gammaproteobacteria bacterium]|nr:BatA and WFA domain-containing protein [Gammaproteobacteria bacterium]